MIVELGKSRDRMGKPHIEIGLVAKKREDLAHQLVLFVLQHVGEFQLVLQIAKIKLGHHFARHPVMKAVDWRFQTLRNYRLGEAKPFEHFDGRRMIGRRTLIHEGLMQCLKRNERHTGLV